MTPIHVTALFTDASILPSQFCTPAPTRSGEQALMRAVLEDAIACLHLGFLAGNAKAERSAREARAWFEADDSSYVFSFVSICWTMGLDVEAVRRRVLSGMPLQKPLTMRERQAATRKHRKERRSAYAT